MNNDYIFLTLLAYVLPSAYSDILSGGYTRPIIDTTLNVSNIVNELISNLRSDLIKSTLANISEAELKEFLYRIPEIQTYCNEYETNIDDTVTAIKKVVDYEANIVY